MNIITFHTTQLETDTYLVLLGKEAFVVDPGADADKITKAAKSAGAKISCVLLTHAHFDHIGGVAELQRSGALVVMHESDVGLISSFKNLAFYAGVKVEKFLPDVTVKGGETLTVAGMPVRHPFRALLRQDGFPHRQFQGAEKLRRQQAFRLAG